MTTLLKVYSYIIILYGLNYLFTKDSAPFAGAHKDGLDLFNFWTQAFALLILAPFIETFFAQLLPIELLLTITFFSKKPLYAILLSATLFGLAHYYSIYYVVYSAGIGVIIGQFYYRLKITKGDAYLYTVLLHAIINLTIFIPKACQILQK